MHKRLHVRRDSGLHGIVALRVEAPGVDQRVVPAERRRIGVMPVTRHPRLVVHDGDSLAREAIEQRRFPDVGAANNGDERQR